MPLPRSPRDKLRLLISTSVPVQGTICRPRVGRTAGRHRSAVNGPSEQPAAVPDREQQTADPSDGADGVDGDYAGHGAESPGEGPSAGGQEHMETGCLNPDPTAYRDRTGQQALWTSRRPELQKQYLLHLAEHWRRTGELVQMHRQQVQAAVNVACSACRHCANLDHMPQHRTVQVLWVGWSYTFPLDIPVSVCRQCGGQSAVQPLEIGCFPSTPVQAWDVCRIPEDARPLWFDLTMLEVGIYWDVQHAHRTLVVRCCAAARHQQLVTCNRHCHAVRVMATCWCADGGCASIVCATRIHGAHQRGHPAEP